MPLSIDRINSKTITVGIVGLGYVGLPLSLVFAEADVKVIGFDIDDSKISSIKAGRSYIKHLAHDRLQKVIENGKFSATTAFAQIAQCDAVIICVPTPLDHHLEPDLSYIIHTT